MQLQLADAVNASAELARAASFGAVLRVMQVDLVPSYGNVTSPRTNLTTSIPWARPRGPVGAGAGAGVVPPGAVQHDVSTMSAFCYLYGVDQVRRRPDMPVGMISSAWGGTTLEVWMSPDALRACDAGAAPILGCAEPTEPSVAGARELGLAPHGAHGVTWPDPGLSAFRTPGRDVPGCPALMSTLYNSMIAPLLPFGVTGFLWYQGESNQFCPERYARCFPAFIEDLRRKFAPPPAPAVPVPAAPASPWRPPPPRPFIFAQISTWPCHDNGMITGIRYAQNAALALPGVGMVVTADIGDPAGVMHPVHPPFKQEVARRAGLIAERLVHGDMTVPLQGPQVVRVDWDPWDSSWVAWHHGTPATGTGVCGPTGAAQGWYCGGIRVTFDRDVVLRPSYGLQYGMRSGFKLFNAATGSAALGGTSLGDRQLVSPLCTNCTVCPCSQELDVGGLVTPRTLQLNTTFIFGKPSVLKYGWNDYPTMILFDADGRPVAPFNFTLGYARAATAAAAVHPPVSTAAAR